MSLADAFGEFIAGTTIDEIPASDRDAVTRSCLDAIGDALAGSRSQPGRIVREYARSQGGSEARIIGSALSAPAPLAALANGTAIHADDFDDGGGYGHPSSAIVAALLAASDLTADLSGGEFLTAYAVGFEVATALHADGRYDQYDRCFNQTPLFGAIAAAGAAARALHLTQGEVASALAIAASQAGGLGIQVGTMVKPLNAGLAANAGVTAAMLAASGIEGASGAFEARGGFNETFFGHRAVIPARVLNSLGNPFKAHHIYVKQFPCCGSNRSALHGVLKVIEREDLQYDDIDEVVVHQMSETAPVLKYPHPVTGLSAKFSIQHTVACMMLRRTVDLDDFEDDLILEPRMAAARAKVRVEVSPRWSQDARPNGHPGGNPVTIRLTDGRVLNDAVGPSAIRGSASNPYSMAEVTRKFRRNACLVLDDETVERAAELWGELSEMEFVRTGVDSVCLEERGQ